MLGRRGSVSLAIAIVLGVLATGAAGGWGLSQRARANRAESALSEVQAQVSTLTGDLGECRARVTAESVTAAATGTTDALTVALAADAAEVQLRADFIRLAQSSELTSAMVRAASPRLLAAERAMDRCAGLTAVKGADLAGCGTMGQVVTAWAGAVAAQAECPRCPECPRVVEPGE